MRPFCGRLGTCRQTATAPCLELRRWDVLSLQRQRWFRCFAIRTMGRSSLRQRPAQLTAAQQIGRMRTKFPGLAVAFKRSRIIWTGDWWPHPLSDTYYIQISYTLGRRPRIAILSPKLKLAPGKTRTQNGDAWTPPECIGDL